MSTSASKHWAFEDFEVGTTIDLGRKLVTAEEIVEFATEFDPQPMHLDEEAGRDSLLGGLAASGWHTCAMFMRLLYDGLLINSTSQGAPGVEQVKWKRPVLAGDTLNARATVVSARPSKSRPTVGIVTIHTEMTNQRGDSVFELDNSAMFLTREATAVQ